MKLNSGSKNSVVLLLTALVLALLFAVYYYLVLPKKDDVDSMTSSVHSLQSEISLIEEQIEVAEAEKNASSVDLFEMRKKVPKSLEMDKLLLSIEQSEYISDSRIVTVEFNNYDSLVAESELKDPNAPTEEELAKQQEQGTDNESTTESEGEASGEELVSSIATETLPPELKLVTFEIEVETRKYENLVNFIKEIENIERVMHIDIIEFELPGEEQEYDIDADETIILATVQVTTFYYEGEE